MARSETYNKWLEEGYNLFSIDGPDGISVEKIARNLDLNKSGFYHYFRDMENYFRRLIKYHEGIHEHFLKEIPDCSKFNPDFLELMLKYKKSVLFQMHLVRSKDNPIFGDTYKIQYDKTSQVLCSIWNDHITINQNPELSIQYFNMVRDMFYSRITQENLNIEFLLTLSNEIHNTAIKFLNEKERLQDNNKELS